MAAFTSFFDCFSFSAARLSCSFRPLPTPMVTLIQDPLRWMLRGTNVKPF